MTVISSLIPPPSLLRSLLIFSTLIFLVLNFPALVSVYLVRHRKTFVFTLFQSFCSSYVLTLGRTGKFIPPTVVKGVGGGGVMESLPSVNDMLQYFENILPLVESL